VSAVGLVVEIKPHAAFSCGQDETTKFIVCSACHCCAKFEIVSTLIPLQNKLI